MKSTIIKVEFNDPNVCIKNLNSNFACVCKDCIQSSVKILIKKLSTSYDNNPDNPNLVKKKHLEIIDKLKKLDEIVVDINRDLLLELELKITYD